MENEKGKEVFQKFQLEREAAQNILDAHQLGEVTSIRRFEEGMINDVFSVNEKYVVKVNTVHPDIPKLEKECAVYQALLGSDIPVPKVYALDVSRNIVPYTYFVCEQLPGRSLESFKKSLNGEIPQEILEEMGECLGRIHVIRPADFPLPGQENYSGLKEDITRRIESIAEELLRTRVLEQEIVTRITSFYTESAFFNEDVKVSLLHGNYVPGNIMVFKDKIVGIIDWEFSSFGHSEEELATFLYRVCKTEEQRKFFQRGYEKHCAISQSFEKRFLAYVLLYYLTVLPSVPTWTHRPDKQREYLDETRNLLKQIEI